MASHAHVKLTHADGSEQTLDLVELVRHTVHAELAAIVAAGDGSQTPVDRELYIRALIRSELASMGGRLLHDYGPKAPAKSDAIIAEPLSSLGGYMTEHYGAVTVHATAQATSESSGG